MSARCADLSFLTDDAAEALELLGHPLVQLDDVVERVGNFAIDAFEVDRQTRTEKSPFLNATRAASNLVLSR